MLVVHNRRSQAVSDETTVDAGTVNSAEVDLGQLEQEGEVAADYLEGLLDIVDLDGDIDMD
ncbi:MAG: hypothetical protein ACRDWG_11805, partial [Actinomycetes bacterium]